MRKSILLVSLIALAACKGGGPTTVGSSAPPTGAPGTTPTPTPTPTQHSFVNPTQTKTYSSAAAAQSFRYRYNELVEYEKVPVLDASGNPVLNEQGQIVRQLDPDTRTLLLDYQDNQLYDAGASTTRSPSTTVTYDPRNAEFTVRINQDGVDSNVTFQDPAHRTDFNGARKPQAGVPNLETGDPSQWRDKGVQYLEADTGSSGQTYDVSTFFYELPGTSTQYVTYAGFVRQHFDAPTEDVELDRETFQRTTLSRGTKLDRAAFVFGEATSLDNVPRSGTGSYSGNMIASMVNNPLLDDDPSTASYLQWISGQAQMNVNFASGSVTTALSGTVHEPYLDQAPIKSPTDLSAQRPPVIAIPTGSTFAAAGTGRIDLVGTGGFTGTFDSASFNAGGQAKPVDIVGSTLDGAFYGPAAQEVGGTFRIVGGIPDQRVDIIGSFTGKK